MQSQRVYGKDEFRNHQMTSTERALEITVNMCDQGHDWQPTIIIGYFQCLRCNTLAACCICVSKMRGKPLVGVCRQHQHLCILETHQEVLA